MWQQVKACLIARVVFLRSLRLNLVDFEYGPGEARMQECSMSGTTSIRTSESERLLSRWQRYVLPSLGGGVKCPRDTHHGMTCSTFRAPAWGVEDSDHGNLGA